MRAASIIVLTSGKAEGLRWKIDDVIQSILDEKRVPILILGPDADILMTAASKIEHCEIVFDPNYSGKEFSGIKAGLHATAQPAFVWNGDGHFPEKQTRILLETAMRDSTEHVLMLPDDPSQALLTREGVLRLRDLAAHTQWRTNPLIRFKFVNATGDTDDSTLPSPDLLLNR
ncbi:MAG TPA: hypothetical protein VM432_14615 [Bdellovibrionales bacterium]|jgi:hypothetical protein|nr:hypothetical protein [Bdellovibrionales bacterium]